MHSTRIRVIKRTIGKILYLSIGIHMPPSFSKFNLGSRKFRQFCAKMILDECGDWVNIERGARFGDSIHLGYGSGIGQNCVIPKSTIIGDYVMMGQDCFFFESNHRTT